MCQDNPGGGVAAVVVAFEWAFLQVAERLRNTGVSNGQTTGTYEVAEHPPKAARIWEMFGCSAIVELQ